MRKINENMNRKDASNKNQEEKFCEHIMRKEVLENITLTRYAEGKMIKDKHRVTSLCKWIVKKRDREEY